MVSHEWQTGQDELYTIWLSINEEVTEHIKFETLTSWKGTKIIEDNVHKSIISLVIILNTCNKYPYPMAKWEATNVNEVA